MNSYPYDLGKKQLEQKLKTTINDNDLETLKSKKEELEIDDKFNYFCNKIIKIILSNINLLEEYKKSDNIHVLKNSDTIKKVMKKYIANIDDNELKNLVKNNNIKIDDEIDDVIKSETQKNMESFIKNFKISKEVQILKTIGLIKTKFAEAFIPREFHINKYDEKINEKMFDYRFKKNEIDEINDLVKLIMEQKFKELINKELKNIK